MKILVISDTHRSQLYFYELLEKIKDIDYVIHCGDVKVVTMRWKAYVGFLSWL